MTAFQDCVEKYWKYYRALEDRFLETERYVEFDLNYNGKAYSMEYMMLFQAICSEIDVVGKVYAQLSDKSFKPDRHTGLNKWWFYVVSRKPSIVEAKCTFRGRNTICPWENFYVIENPDKSNKNRKSCVLDTNRKAATPLWWNAYNGAKHNRSGDNGKNYRKASLQNVLSALAALYVLETNMLTDTFDKRKDKTLGIGMESHVFDDQQSFYTYLLAVD